MTCNASTGRRHSACSAGVRASSDVSSLTVGEGSFTRSHGLRIDCVDNVWVTDMVLGTRKWIFRV
jgi:hypothetical protein